MQWLQHSSAAVHVTCVLSCACLLLLLLQADLLSWLLPTLTPEKSCEGYEQLIKDTAATMHALLQT
jgi:hypothetical protein